MKLTKNDMARVIVQALYQRPKLPAADDKRVLKQASYSRVVVEDRYNKAHAIITEGIAKGTWPKD